MCCFLQGAIIYGVGQIAVWNNGMSSSAAAVAAMNQQEVVQHLAALTEAVQKLGEQAAKQTEVLEAIQVN